MQAVSGEFPRQDGRGTRALVAGPAEQEPMQRLLTALDPWPCGDSEHRSIILGWRRADERSFLPVFMGLAFARRGLREHCVHATGNCPGLTGGSAWAQGRGGPKNEVQGPKDRGSTLNKARPGGILRVQRSLGQALRVTDKRLPRRSCSRPSLKRDTAYARGWSGCSASWKHVPCL